MLRRNDLQGLLARFSHPLLVLLIAAIAAVSAIAQCGLMLDAEAVGRPVADTPASAAADASTQPAERPHIAAAQGAATSSDAARPN